jgi:hypothetical protein
MRVVGWLRSPSSRRGLVVATVLGGCFTWAMMVVGVSFAMVERGRAAPRDLGRHPPPRYRDAK